MLQQEYEASGRTVITDPTTLTARVVDTKKPVSLDALQKEQSVNTGIQSLANIRLNEAPATHREILTNMPADKPRKKKQKILFYGDAMSEEPAQSDTMKHQELEEKRRQLERQLLGR